MQNYLTMSIKQRTHLFLSRSLFSYFFSFKFHEKSFFNNYLFVLSIFYYCFKLFKRIQKIANYHMQSTYTKLGRERRLTQFNHVTKFQSQQSHSHTKLSVEFIAMCYY